MKSTGRRFLFQEGQVTCSTGRRRGEKEEEEDTIGRTDAASKHMFCFQMAAVSLALRLSCDAAVRESHTEPTRASARHSLIETNGHKGGTRSFSLLPSATNVSVVGSSGV